MARPLRLVRLLRGPRPSQKLARRVSDLFVAGRYEKALQLIERISQRRKGKEFSQFLDECIGELHKKQLVVAALQIADRYPKALVGQPHKREFDRFLESKWTPSGLVCRETKIVFHRPVRVEVTRNAAGQVHAAIRDLEMERLSSSAVQCIEDLTSELRKEISKVHGKLTHTLKPQERARKELLLGLVDLARSGFLTPDPSSVKVFGEIEADERGELRFRAMDASSASFEIPRSLRSDRTRSGMMGYATLTRGTAGEPIGQVQALEIAEERMKKEELRTKWQQFQGRRG